MAETVRLCAICGKRRPKRFCPGVHGDICPICCGTEREVTVNCPLDCGYLQDARRHDPLPQVDPRQTPNTDIRIDDSFLQRNEALLILLATAVGRASLSDNTVFDSDVKEALEALVKTWRTLQSGLVYESRPPNPLAARVFNAVEESVSEIRRRLAEHEERLRDDDILGVLVFLQRLEIQNNNGRPKGRAFIDFLRGFFPAAPESGLIATGPESGSLIITP